MRDSRSPSAPRGRYAPSPTGEIHLGNASTALLAWLSIRARAGRFLMRVEDLDRARSREELTPQILEDLTWLGLDWDEGPDVGGPYAPYVQSQRFHRYAAAFEQLRAEGRLYPCFCSRKDIAAAASAPQIPGDEVLYPGTCRDRPEEEWRGRVAAGERHAWRFRFDSVPQPEFHDLVHGLRHSGTPGDFVVHRSDGVPAYQLAVVVDDAEMEIDEVVRGDDLLGSTPRQLALFDALGLSRPVFAHVPLLLGTDGVRLSKRHQDITLRELRRRAVSPEQVVGALAHLLGLREQSQPLRPGDLIEGFEIGSIRHDAPPIRVEPKRLFPQLA